ncbi:enoyl-CoA hydratase [Panacagrimonas sp.]|uniref:enoyl-CoA hydratase n=1 Tax=Panacagrimonas sp. TaxID=2480088 RepID=UPI003B51584E
MSEATADSTLLISRDHGVLTLRLNRAEKKNALTQAMYSRLADSINAAADDPAVRVLLIAGVPGAFCAGNDMVDFMKVASTGGGGGDSAVIRFMNALAAFPKPAVAAVNGLAIGVGVTMLLHCDLIYASEGARFTLPFVNIGIVPEYASTYLMPRIMGHSKAMELVLFGEPFTARHARECGLVNEVLDDDAVEARALERAQRLAQQPPKALRTTKRLMKRWTDSTVAEAIPLEAFHFVPMLSQPEAQEAIGAFLQKRKPDFSRFS